MDYITVQSVLVGVLTLTLFVVIRLYNSLQPSPFPSNAPPSVTSGFSLVRSKHLMNNPSADFCLRIRRSRRKRSRSHGSCSNVASPYRRRRETSPSVWHSTELLACRVMLAERHSIRMGNLVSRLDMIQYSAPETLRPRAGRTWRPISTNAVSSLRLDECNHVLRSCCPQ